MSKVLAPLRRRLDLGSHERGPARGALRRYEQWNIDPGSVVSFAGMAFYR